MNRKIFTLICFLFLSLPLFAQDDLLQMLSDSTAQSPNYTYGTFKTTRIVNFQSVEIIAPRELQLLISHRFGRLNTGAYNFFGLDEAHIRLGFEYGVNKLWAVGIGRSSEGKTFDAYHKLKLLRQSDKTPVTLVLFNSMALATEPKFGPQDNRSFKHRFTYTTQLLIARKFSERLSLQFIPSYIHRNLVELDAQENDILSLGIGGRFKISKRVTINGEYNYLLSEQTAMIYTNTASMGLDIDTGGHIFQLFFSTSRGMIEPYFIARNMSYLDKGDIYYGFNISRVFGFKKKEKKSW